MTSTTRLPRQSRHFSERFATRIGWHAAVVAVLQLGSIDNRSRTRVGARELEAAAAERRSDGEYGEAKILEKIKKITVVLGEDGCLVTTFRGGKARRAHDDRLERRRERRRNEARRRGRMIGR